MVTLKGIAKGAALGTVLGSIAVILYPKRQAIMEAVLQQTENLPEKARDYVDMVLNRKNHSFVNGYWTAGLAGLFLGAGMALTMAPKTGRQFRTQLMKTYNEVFRKTPNVVQFFKNNAHPIHAVIRPKKRSKKVLKSRHSAH